VVVSVPHGLGASVNRNALGQVLVNVLGNALDAIEDGGGTRIAVTAEREGERTVLSLTDDGIGMTPEQLRRAQEPFFTTKDVGKGTGLGLSICREILSDAGGTLVMRSTWTSPGTP